MIDRENIIPDDVIIKEYCKFSLPDEIMEDLHVFLLARGNYIDKPDLDNRVSRKQAFDNIYHNTKYAFHVKYMTEQDFVRLTNMLRKGV